MLPRTGICDAGGDPCSELATEPRAEGGGEKVLKRFLTSSDRPPELGCGRAEGCREESLAEGRGWALSVETGPLTLSDIPEVPDRTEGRSWKDDVADCSLAPFGVSKLGCGGAEGCSPLTLRCVL